MRRLALGLWLGLGLLFSSVGQAQIVPNNKLTIVPTQAVEPLQILVRSHGEDGLFSGEVLSRRPLKASVLQFTLLDKYQGVAWRDELELPDRSRRIMPFYFPAIGSTDPLFLSVQAYDDFGNTKGSGHQYIELQEAEPSINVTYSDVFLDDTPQLNFTMFMENGAVAQTYLPEIKIYQGLEHFGDLQRTLYQDSFTLDPRQRKESSFNVPFDFTPGVYEVVLTLVDPVTKKALSSAFHQQIYRSGDYFKIMNLEAYYVTEDRAKAHLDVSGLSTIVLTEPVQMQVKLQHQRNIFYDKSVGFTLQPGYFTKTLELDLPPYVNELSGSATFFLKGKKFQTVTFNSDTVRALKSQDSADVPAERTDLKPTGPLVLQSGEGMILTDQQVLMVVVGCTVLLLLLVLGHWLRARWLVWAGLILGGGSFVLSSSLALTVGRDVFPMVEWSNPMIGESVAFNPSSTKGFQWLPIKGRVFNYLTQKALLNNDEFSRIRFNLFGPSGQVLQYEVHPDMLKEGSTLYSSAQSGSYYFVIDLGRLADVEPLGGKAPVKWEEGTWQMQLLFPYQQRDNQELWLATPLEDFGHFEIDEQPPLWQWQLQDVLGVTLGENDFTNQGINVVMQCQDKANVCTQAQRRFLVRGNFCGDGTQCNTTAPRAFELCDQVGNCSQKTLSVRGYDPVPPSLDVFALGSNRVALANEEYPITLRYADPTRIDAKAWEDYFQTQLCGEENPHFYLDEAGEVCKERRQACVIDASFSAWRGQSIDGACEPLCPAGYHFENGSCQTVCGRDEFTGDRLCLPFELQNGES